MASKLPPDATAGHAALVATLRAAFPDYQPVQPTGDDLAYLASLGLPDEIAAFYRQHTPLRPIGNSSQLLSIPGMRSEHEDCEPGLTLRRLGGSVLATANGNPYFCVTADDGYRILYADHQTVDDSDETLDNVLALAPEELTLTFPELVRAVAAQVLPASPVEMERFRQWRASSSGSMAATSPDSARGGVTQVSLPATMHTIASRGDALLLGPDHGGGPLYEMIDGPSHDLVLRPIANPEKNITSLVARADLVLVCGLERLMRSIDGGASFTAADTTGDLEGVACEADGTVWLARKNASRLERRNKTGKPQLGYSSDRGASFTWLDLPVPRVPHRFSPTPRGLLACAGEHLLFIESRRLRAVPTPPGESVSVALETDSRALVIVTNGGGAYRSEDSGERWAKSAGPVSAASCIVQSGGGSIHVGYEALLFSSTDDGRSFALTHQLEHEVKRGVRHGERAVFVGRVLYSID